MNEKEGSKHRKAFFIKVLNISEAAEFELNFKRSDSLPLLGAKQYNFCCWHKCTHCTLCIAQQLKENIRKVKVHLIFSLRFVVQRGALPCSSSVLKIFFSFNTCAGLYIAARSDSAAAPGYL